MKKNKIICTLEFFQMINASINCDPTHPNCSKPELGNYRSKVSTLTNNKRGKEKVKK